MALTQFSSMAGYYHGVLAATEMCVGLLCSEQLNRNMLNHRSSSSRLPLIEEGLSLLRAQANELKNEMCSILKWFFIASSDMCLTMKGVQN